MAITNPPEGYHSVTPYLVIAGAEAAIDFYARAFGAVEKLRLPMGDKIGHAELQIGSSIIMVADEFPDMDILGPRSRGGPTASFLIYVPDVDAAFEKAIAAGGTIDKPITTQFWGDRIGALIDPFGHKWSIATVVEEVPEAEMQKRMEAFSAEN